MLIVEVQVRVRPERIEDFLAATLVNARASLRGNPVAPDHGDLRAIVLQAI